MILAASLLMIWCAFSLAAGSDRCIPGSKCRPKDKDKCPERCDPTPCIGAMDPVCGVCVPIICVAADQCHDPGTCDPASGVCSNPPKPDGATCDDGNACTSGDACQRGVCVGAPVDDGTPCDDGNVCTSGDTCQHGVCVGGTSSCLCPGGCNDEDACTVDECRPDGCHHGLMDLAALHCEFDRSNLMCAGELVPEKIQNRWSLARRRIRDASDEAKRRKRARLVKLALKALAGVPNLVVEANIQANISDDCAIELARVIDTVTTGAESLIPHL